MQGSVSKWETGYGDMAPWGDGPDPHEIQRRGEPYLAKKFPLLDYWTGCRRRGAKVDL
jgi:peptidyl-prolyl cis-trans isomerase A (cyclophilin A)